MSGILSIPEIKAISSSKSLLRLPDQTDVPLTDRVIRIIDTATFQRLKNVSQLGFVSFVYPGATHNRFEHSLGVYRLALQFLVHLANDPRFCESVTEEDAELLIVSALLHDIAHWPFCHPIEDLQLPGVPQHESLANKLLLESEIAEVLEKQWKIDPANVCRLLTKQVETQSEKILSSILSGPIDVDKMDYLRRDSHHSGVPYGKNFDSQRLISSLCLSEDGDRIAITSKGKTAAELMVFARYVMFSEVYWHHAVRSATAMFQRAFFLLHDQVSEDQLAALFQCEEYQIADTMRVIDVDQNARELIDSLFGSKRKLYKRWGQFGMLEQPELHAQIARQPYKKLVILSEALEQEIPEIGGNHGVLIDAPPIGLEVQFNVEVFDEKNGMYHKLENISPVIKSLASDQFDSFVKQVRLFVRPTDAEPRSLVPLLRDLLRA